MPAAGSGQRGAAQLLFCCLALGRGAAPAGRATPTLCGTSELPPACSGDRDKVPEGARTAFQCIVPLLPCWRSCWRKRAVLLPCQPAVPKKLQISLPSAGSFHLKLCEVWGFRGLWQGLHALAQGQKLTALERRTPSLSDEHLVVALAL